MSTNSPPPDSGLATSQTSNTGQGGQAAETLSPLEQEVLDEYARLVDNLNNLSTLLATISATPSAEILDHLRRLERKTSLVFTLLKSSVYSIVMQQQAFAGSENETIMGFGGMGSNGGIGAEESRLD